MRQDLQTTPNNDAGNASRLAARDAQQGRGQQQQQPYVVPPVDVFEDDNGITLLADLPGVTRDNLQLRVDGDSLQIEAVASTAGPRNMELVYGEAQVPAYRRRFTLSRELDTARIEAQLKDGVLRLVIPKAEQAKPRRVEIKAG
jgi:HSP20 family protein